MKVIPPITVTPAMLTSSTAIETTPAVYAGATTYAPGALVYVGTVGQALAVYQSLAGANTGNAPASSPAWWQAMGSVYAEYAAGTSYAALDIIQVAATHLVYQSIVGANTGNAVTDATKWVLVGPTNKWAMFDLFRNTATAIPSPLTVVIAPGQRINSLGFVGLQSNSVTVSVDIGATNYYTRTLNTLLRKSINWTTFLFSPFAYKSSSVLFDLPPISGATITITIAGGAVKCGGIVMGRAVYVGAVQYNAVRSALNFSPITRDNFGNATLVQRRSVPRTDQKLLINKALVNSILQLIVDLNAVPALWSGLDDQTSSDYFEALLILGIYKELSVSLDHPTAAIVGLQLEEI